jgi:hypothetical protein
MPWSFYNEKSSETINHTPYPLREKNKLIIMLQNDLRWVLAGSILGLNMKARYLHSATRE